MCTNIMLEVDVVVTYVHVVVELSASQINMISLIVKGS